ncbi:MAG: S8 family peptidase [Sphingobacteriales bacterium]|nr:S8 family peptidase [Sphingobacteriales bacterium]
MKKLLLLGLLCVLTVRDLQAQYTRFIVKLRDKGNSGFSLANPAAYLSPRALDRRTRYSIAIDSADLPVTPSYLTQIRNIPNVTILNVSKWLNAVSIQTSDPNAITSINALPFVQTVSGLAARTVVNERTATRNKFVVEAEQVPLPLLTQKGEGLTGDYFNYGTGSYNEIHLHNGEFLHNIGMRGQGMQVAMLDGGFFNYTSLKAFDSANTNGQIISTWDFVARESSVTEDHPHGMQCLSTIVGNIPGQFIGKAPKASFYLFRTEDVATEYPIEEHNWVCAAERADSAGADIISSSLGYYDFDDAAFNYTYNQMDGNTTLAAKGADMAAKKGLLVFNSAGNEGGNAWHFLVTPSDGDSVVAVGAVSTSGAVGGFSSYGPSADGQVKPDLASVGVAALVQNTGNSISAANGTSFACPNMAGLGTCLWQAFPEYNNMKILQALKQSANKYATPDDRIGYGIPNMKLAFTNLLTEYASSNATVNSCTAALNWTSKDVQPMKYEIERMAPGESSFTKIGEASPQAGNILAIHTYQFNNSLAGLNAGTVSYRIRQIVDTATASFAAVYIDTATATVAAGCFATGTGNTDPLKEKISLQPNPVSGSTVSLVIETPYAITDMPVIIYDAKGSRVLQQRSTKGSGKKTIELSISRLSTGKYYISVYNGQQLLGTSELIKL